MFASGIKWGGPGGPGDIFVREIKESAVGLSYNFDFTSRVPIGTSVWGLIMSHWMFGEF